MNRLHTATRGVGSWQERLADPERQWKRGYSAFETAVSWERAARRASGLPEPIERLIHEAYGEPALLLAVAEHKVRLPGGRADSQNDVWALVKTSQGTVSMSVEGKVAESFGPKTLEKWLGDGKSELSEANRAERWDYIRAHLPAAADGAYLTVAYQLLHRCAAAVIEAERFGLSKAAFVVQRFASQADHYTDFELFCRVLGFDGGLRGHMQETSVTTKAGTIKLQIGWADCPHATDAEIAEVV